MQGEARSSADFNQLHAAIPGSALFAAIGGQRGHHPRTRGTQTIRRNAVPLAQVARYRLRPAHGQAKVAAGEISKPFTLGAPRSTIETQLVALQPDNCGFSWSVSVQGKARLAVNGRSPLQEPEHGQRLRSQGFFRCRESRHAAPPALPWTLTGQPFGRSCGAPLLRSAAWQGRRPFPARRALQRRQWRQCGFAQRRSAVGMPSRVKRLRNAEPAIIRLKDH